MRSNGSFDAVNLGIIMLVDVVIWFYSFFHVHNLAGMPDEEFMNTKDDYLFNLDIFFKENGNLKVHDTKHPGNLRHSEKGQT